MNNMNFFLEFFGISLLCFSLPFPLFPKSSFISPVGGQFFSNLVCVGGNSNQLWPVSILVSVLPRDTNQTTVVDSLKTPNYFIFAKWPRTNLEKIKKNLLNSLPVTQTFELALKDSNFSESFLIKILSDKDKNVFDANDVDFEIEVSLRSSRLTWKFFWIDFD